MMNFFNKKQRGQGSLEYLLIIGGALVIAVIVVTLILSLGSNQKVNVENVSKNSKMLIDNTITPPIVTNVVCHTDKIIVSMNPSPDPRIKGYRIKKDNLVLNPATFLNYSDGQIMWSATIVPEALTVGDKHKISVIAYKNDTQSRPSTPSFNCTVIE